MVPRSDTDTDTDMVTATGIPPSVCLSIPAAIPAATALITRARLTRGAAAVQWSRRCSNAWRRGDITAVLLTA